MTNKKSYNYEYVFKIIGYGDDINYDYDEPLDIEIDNNSIIPIFRDNSKKKSNLWYFYNFIIFSLLSWKIIYTLYYSILKHDINYGSLITFPLLVLSQYGVGIAYFNKQYFHSKMMQKKHRDKYNIYLIIASLIGFIITIISIAFLWVDIDVGAYSEIFVNQTIPIKSGITILMFFDNTISHQIIAVNFTVFIANLLFDKNTILKMEADITQGVNSTMDSDIKIKKVAGEYKATKAQFEKNISETGSIFESFNILTFIHLGFLANMIVNNNIYIFQIIYAVIYIVIYIIFLHVINTVNNVAGNIDQLLKKNLYLANFFQDNTILYANEDPNITTDQYLEEIIAVLYFNTKKILEINQKTGWKILHDEIKEEWASYTIMGFIKVDGTSIVTKLLAILVMIFFSTNLGDLFSL